MFKISKISWLVFLGYIVLGIVTFFLIDNLKSAQNLFTSTEFLLQFNLVWFGFFIMLYGLYALFQNYRRIKRLGLEESLDTQFLIVATFFFMTIYAILDFYSYVNKISSDSTFGFALESTAKVFFYGAFMTGLLSIILPKLMQWFKKSSGA